MPKSVTGYIIDGKGRKVSFEVDSKSKSKVLRYLQKEVPGVQTIHIHVSKVNRKRVRKP